MGWLSWEDAESGLDDFETGDDPEPSAKDIKEGFTWLAPDGTSVPFEVQLLWRGQGLPFYYQLAPTEELGIGQHFLAPVGDLDSRGTRAFEVDDRRIEEPPRLLKVHEGETVSESEEDSPCGASEFVGFNVEHDGRFVVVDFDRASDTSREGEVILGDVFVSGPAIIGYRPCQSNSSFEKEGSARVRFAAFDLAGQRSEWSDIVIVEPPGCACATAGSGRNGGTPAALGLLFGVGWLARRARR